LQAVLGSQLFVRSPTLTHLLSYLCQKALAGQSDQIKEYSVALDVFGRSESFDQDSDSIVRVEVNRLRKRLAEYYAGEGRSNPVRITIPVGQYVPIFEPVPTAGAKPEPPVPSEQPLPQVGRRKGAGRIRPVWAVIAVLAVLGVTWLLLHERSQRRAEAIPSAQLNSTRTEVPATTGAAEEVRIMAGSTRNYVDHSGKLWSPDVHFVGGTPVRSPVQKVWRTQDSAIYRTSRQGNFRYDIPLKPGTYELRLHFAETYYGPEEATGGGEGSRVMTVTANDKLLLNDFDVLADSGGGRTADVKVFTDISPAADGLLHLQFSSSGGGVAMVSAIEIVPGVRGRIRPVRIVPRDLPYYSNDSQWWSADAYFKGGQLGGSAEPARGTDDPELYETERWGHFSYAIPVAPGKYTVILHFVEHRTGLPADSTVGAAESTAAAEPRIFDVFCNGKRIVTELNIRELVGESHALVRKAVNLEPNAQGKLLLEFVPVSHYATVSAIEVLPQ